MKSRSSDSFERRKKGKKKPRQEPAGPGPGPGLLDAQQRKTGYPSRKSKAPRLLHHRPLIGHSRASWALQVALRKLNEERWGEIGLISGALEEHSRL